MNVPIKKPFLRPIVCIFMTVSKYSTALGQLKGTHLVGDVGLQAGSLPPPSLSIVAQLSNYRTSTFIRGNGDKIDAPDISALVLGAGGNVVTNKKIFGGNYGAGIMLSFASNKIEGNTISSNTKIDFYDNYIQPIELEWGTQKADFSFGYALYLPTGKYQLGGSNNAGLGMLTNEFSAGATLYFDTKKEWNYSALFSYAINSPKKNTGDNDITVGNLLTWEGGLGKTWYLPVKENPLPMIINAGLVYYVQYKTTNDKMKIPSIDSSSFTLKNKDHIFALGAEANIFIPGLKATVDIRWTSEVGASDRTEGNSFFITITPYIKFFKPTVKKASKQY